MNAGMKPNDPQYTAIMVKCSCVTRVQYEGIHLPVSRERIRPLLMNGCWNGTRMAMEIRFGRPLVSSDGERVGTAVGLMLDIDGRSVREILVLHGTEERAIPYQSIIRVDADGIIDLNLTAFEVQQMTRTSGIAGTGVNQTIMPYTSWVSGEGIVPSYTGSMHDNQPYRPSEETEPDIVEIDAEIVVAGPDGKIVGTIAGLAADDAGAVQELMISTGFLRPDIRVDMDSVAYAEGTYVSHIG